MKLIQAAFLLALFAPTVHAQQRTVDEGTLIILHDGAPVGRESFRILSEASTGGQAFQSTAQISYNLERISTLLITDSLGAPLKYDLEVKIGGKLDMHLLGNGASTRFRSLARTPHGEFSRDYIMGDNPLVLDVNAFHQYYFITLQPRRSQFSVLEPRTGKQSTLRFEDRGNESMLVGRRSVVARHLALIATDGSTRDVWVDPGGRLLRVAIPASGLVALRDDLPR